jgi:inosose dehydratase
MTSIPVPRTDRIPRNRTEEERNVDRSDVYSRRQFVRLGASLAALPALGGLTRSAAAGDDGPQDPWRGLKIGVASYTFHKLTTDAAVAAVKKVGVEFVSIKDAHLPLKSTREERKAVVKQFRDAGVTPISCGVITLKDDESAARSAFKYARDASIPTIVCNPARAALPMLERLVKEYDIRLAIHNHGPEDKIWPSPFDVWEAVEPLDPRIGLCIDVGHTRRAGVDPSVAIRKCATRLFDVHMKDIDGEGPKARPVEVGRGALDVRGMLQALIDIKYGYHVGLEYEKDANDPIPGAAESIGYLRGVLSGLPKNRIVLVR